MKTVKLLLLGILAVSFAGCTDDVKLAKPPVTGKIGEIVVIVETKQWRSEIGDTLRAVFEKPFPMLPQTEKSYSLLNVDYSSFVPAMQRHRNIITVSVSNEYTEAKVMPRHDSWAMPQTVFNVVGPDAHSVAEAIHNKAGLMTDIMEQAELDRQAYSAKTYADPDLHKAIKENLGVSMFVPTGYYMLNKKKDFMWIESQSNYTSMGILMYTYPFKDDSTFTVKYLVDKRDQILKENVPGARDSSWMTTTKYVMPELKIKEYKGQTYGEMRGLWELENDYMGGPFVSRSYIDRKNNRIVTVEGYIYAPRFDKRDYVRRIEGIINTFSLNDEEKAGPDSLRKPA